MRVAILIGVSEYDSITSLPACNSDVDAFHKLLIATSLYGPILKISARVEGSKVKAKVLTFLEGLKGEEIEEVFFYYSGHGEFTGDELYYLMSDYDSKKRRQTSIENAEVDNWLRSLNPSLAIKVIDSCYSGVAYVKNNQSLKGYLENSGGGYKNCYFLLSSQADQESYLDSHLSYFSKSILAGISQRPDGCVRYKDIIDAVSDSFESGGNQEPQFVIQAPMKEVFCNLDDSLRVVLADLLDVIEPQPSNAVQLQQQLSLKELVAREAEKYCSKEKTAKILADLKDTVLSFTYPPELQDIYSFETTFLEPYELDFLPQPEVIGRWLSARSAQYFAYAVKEEIQKQNFDISGYPTFPRTRTVFEITDFWLTTKQAYDVIRIIAKAKFPNIVSYEMAFVIISSKKAFRLFYYSTYLIDKNWDDKECPENVKWLTSEFDLQVPQVIMDSIYSFIDKFTSGIRNDLEKKFVESNDPD